MIQGRTASGFDYTIPEENMNNYELLEAVGELEENPLGMSKVVNLLLGKEQAKLLKEHIRTDGGIVPADLFSNEIIEIFQNQSKTKNSLSLLE